MTANIHNVESISTVENKIGATNKDVQKNPINNQISELREADPKGYLQNIKQMDNLGLDPKSCPKLELLGPEEMLLKKQLLTNDAKKLTEDFGGNLKDPKKFEWQDFSVKDLEIKIKIDLASNSKKDSEVNLPNYVIHDKDV
ncbi:hypothetical protein BH10CYA1_BH10CYA1_01860 [soil metagenome]